MSEGYQDVIRNTRSIWETMTTEEKNDILEWCPISDEVIKRRYPNLSVDLAVDHMTTEELADVHKEVMETYRKRKARRKIAINYLRQEGRESQARELEEQQKNEDEKMEQLVAAQGAS